MTSIRRDPFFQEHATLPFDEDVTGMTDEQRRDWFISRWMDTVRPFSRYPSFFKDDDTTVKLRLIKNLYTSFVIRDNRTEYDFMVCLDRVLSTGGILSKESLTRASDALAKEKERQPARRRKRI